MSGKSKTGNEYPIIQYQIRDINSREEGHWDLFGDTGIVGEYFSVYKTDIDIIAGIYSTAGVDFSALPENAGRLFELSSNAFDAVIHAWMSEFPVTGEIVRYGQKVLKNRNRREAEKAASDRGDTDVRVLTGASYKVWHEIQRLKGLLRFCPDDSGVYIACCEPDHFVLPAFGSHFRERFGDTPWVIIDEKRRLFLRCANGTDFEFGLLDLFEVKQTANSKNTISEYPSGEWENLWKHYHKTINNESRNNPGLQKRFMPKRYWKYLTELQK